jgi:Holliday junction resolvasome RuvABC DNA-binding subunit
MFRRNRIAQEHRQIIVQAFENEDEDYLLVADTLGVNRSTARGIVLALSEKDESMSCLGAAETTSV